MCQKPFWLSRPCFRDIELKVSNFYSNNMLLNFKTEAKMLNFCSIFNVGNLLMLINLLMY